MSLEDDAIAQSPGSGKSLLQVSFASDRSLLTYLEEDAIAQGPGSGSKVGGAVHQLRKAPRLAHDEPSETHVGST